MIEVSIERAITDIKKKFSHVNETQVNNAINLAINRSVTTARTAAVREIQKKYKIGKKYLQQEVGEKKYRYSAIRVWRSSGRNMTGKILAYGKQLPLVAFPFTESKEGITVEVFKGHPKKIPSAFFAGMKSGHLSIFGKGKYTKEKFNWRNKRLVKYPKPDIPIQQLMTTTVRKAIMQPNVLEAMKTKVEQTFPKRFEHELSRLIAN